ncbi:MAG: hypothetical protein IT305_18830 [Chloroflexi bacterium]|nr:hypothetical protein [Chloroflexota bacterium]
MELCAAWSFDLTEALGAMPVRRGRLSLRVTLVSMLLGLLVLTAASFATAAHFSASRVVDELQARVYRVAVLAVESRLDAYLDPALPFLVDAQRRFERNLLQTDDQIAIQSYLIDQLRLARTVGWLSFSHQASGRFIGAWRRDDGAVVLNRSDPVVDGGRPTEYEVTPSDLLLPFARDLPSGYDPRERPWYQAATAADAIVWTEPFEFNEGRMGITAALAVRSDRSGEPLGVVTADFFLDDVTRFLTEIAGTAPGHDTQLLLLSRSGKMVAASSQWPTDRSTALAAAALAAVPGGVSAIPTEAPMTIAVSVAGTSYLATFQAFDAPNRPGWIIGVVLPTAEEYAVVAENQRNAVMLGLIFLAIAAMLGLLVAHRVARPLDAIARDLQRVGRFEIGAEDSPSSFITEIAVVSDSVDRMKAGLRSFGRYVPAELVRSLLASGQEARLGGQHRRLTVLFSDIEGFTRISERMPPGELVDHLGEYLSEMTATVRAELGVIDKFIGDGILALFNAPLEVSAHAEHACRAALRSQARLDELRVNWLARGRPPLRARIGLHVGGVLVGNIGTPERFEYTVLGDAVNLASRLEALNKLYGTWVLASGEVREETGDLFEWRTVDRVAVAGRDGPTLIHELLGERGQVERRVLDARDTYEQGLAHYLDRRFVEAAEAFRLVLTLQPDDLAADVMARRAEALVEAPPLDGWDGVYLQPAKL